MMISVPAIIGDSTDILTPNPLYSPETAIPEGGSDAPETADTAGDPIGDMFE
jgi:hypothetical protein